MLIADTETLRDFCRSLQGAPYLAVDTEFLRDDTYDAQLCLVQVAYGEHAAAIDPLAEGIDMGPLAKLLNDKSTVKVLHSASQDLGIFLRVMGEITGPVFDTQIAASVCGHQDPAPKPQEPGGALPAGAESVVTLLRALLKLRCDAADVSPPMIAKRDDLEAIVTGQRENIPALSGWRRESFGKDAEDLVAGRLALAGSPKGAREVRLAD